jgi:phosphodiesterase/alkaline phosphatase D-like protein
MTLPYRRASLSAHPDELPMLNRRKFLALNSALAAGAFWGRASEWIPPLLGEARAAQEAWDSGALFHVLPTVNHERILLKCSFRTALTEAPELRADGRRIGGQRNDTAGRHWQFEADGLDPARTYGLELVSGDGAPLAEPWEIATFPAPDAEPDHVRIGFYACAGGHDVILATSGKQPTAIRRALLDKLISLGPQAVVANGDQVYWDINSPRLSANFAMSEAGLAHAGRLDPAQPLFGTTNETFILKGGVEQIAPLYRTACRSIPTFFVMDDHDYYDNDEATDELITFPPNDIMRRLARATQKLAYPEFLPDPFRPRGLPGTLEGEGRSDLASNYGTLRYGKLLEILLYDTRQSGTMHGPSAVFVDRAVEDWLRARMRESEARHVVNAPSLPPGWAKGNWYEWYPDQANEPGIDLTKPKPYWQQGWLSQHDRLLAAMTGMGGKIPLIVSGDIHATVAGRIYRTGDVDMRNNPVVSIVPGTPGTARGYHDDVFIPEHLDAENLYGPIGANGFMVADFYRDRIECAFYVWSAATQSVEEIPMLTPAFNATLEPAA